MPHISIQQSAKDYEQWLRSQLKDDFVAKDLDGKHDKMASSAFAFLRATYWRWAETVLDLCPDLAKAPAALAVGDIHLENFGTWRDDDGRLTWGVNDFDEAADMPYGLDPLRLAVSAVLADKKASTKEICAAILEGYQKGLEAPQAFVLDDEDHTWLRKQFIASEEDRTHFWQKIDALPKTSKPVPEEIRKAIIADMPEQGLTVTFRPRTAGTGSLGRPRFVGIADWRGGRVVREGKALLPSGWTLVEGRGAQKLRNAEIVAGTYRAPDPWYCVDGSVVVRRLSPNTHKIEVEDDASVLLAPKMLAAMGHELANIHLGTGQNKAAIKKDIDARKGSWLTDAADKAAEFVRREYKDWAKG